MLKLIVLIFPNMKFSNTSPQFDGDNRYHSDCYVIPFTVHMRNIICCNLLWPTHIYILIEIILPNHLTSLLMQHCPIHNHVTSDKFVCVLLDMMVIRN